MASELASRICHQISAVFSSPTTHPPALNVLVSSRPFPDVTAGPSSTVSAGARVMLLTAQPEGGSSEQYVTVVAYVPAQTMADYDDGEGRERTRQLMPMGSVYEVEMAVYMLGEALGESQKAIRIWSRN